MFEAYSVAVRLRLINEVSHGLMSIASQFTATDAAAKALQARIHAIKSQAMAGAAMFGTGAVMAAPFIFAIDKAAQLQKQMIAIQIATRGSNDEMTNMRKNIEGIAAKTIFSNIDVAKMGKLVATGTGLGATDVSKLLPIYAKFADVQMLMKGTGYEESTKDAIRLAHTAQHYDPASLSKYMDLLTKASMIVPGNLGEVGHALKYSQGIGKTALGIDDENMVLLTSLLNRLGFAGSRGGTNLIAAMSRTIPGVFGSGLLTGKSAEALDAMGMVGAGGKSKFFKDGKFDAFSWMSGLSEYVAREFAKKPEATARQDIMKNFQHAFGSQGARVATLLADPQALQQFKLIGQTFQQYGGAEAMQEKFANESVAQQWMNAKTNFVSAMTELGITLLPAASTGLKTFNKQMLTLIQWVTEHPKTVKALTYAFLSLSGALMFGGLVNMVAAGFKGIGLALSLLKAVKMAQLVASISGAGGLVSALVGNAGLVVAAGAAGFAIGTLINKLLGIDKGQLGSWIYDSVHKTDKDPIGWKGNQFVGAEKNPQFNDMTQGLTPRFQTVRPGSSNKSVQVTTKIHLDGRKVADVVTNHQANAADRPQLGSGMFDTLLTPSPVSY